MLVVFSFIFVPGRKIIFGYNLLASLNNYLKDFHCVESACIWSFSGPYFHAFGINTERYRVSLHITCKCGKIRTRQTLNTDTFYVVLLANNLVEKPKKYSTCNKTLHSCQKLCWQKINFWSKLSKLTHYP